MASSLSLRAEPNAKAEVVQRLTINTQVLLLSKSDAGQFFEEGDEMSVWLADGGRTAKGWTAVVFLEELEQSWTVGWVASRYLGLAPLTATTCETRATEAKTGGDFKESLSWWQRAIALAPDSVTALRGLALAYRAVGDERSAKPVEARLAKIELTGTSADVESITMMCLSPEGSFVLTPEDRCGGTDDQDYAIVVRTSGNLADLMTLHLATEVSHQEKVVWRAGYDFFVLNPCNEGGDEVLIKAWIGSSVPKTLELQPFCGY
jgi:hypothetical protein